jgi:hypothetical protein
MQPPSSASQQDLPPAQDQEGIAAPHRMFLFEPGWKIGVKTGSHREFCYMVAPGQDYYHRLIDKEIFLFHQDEKLCLACAMRRGLIAFQPKRLREGIVAVPADLDAIPLELGWTGARGRSESSPPERGYLE